MSGEIPLEVKALLDRACRDEDPSSADRMAVRRALAARLGVAMAAGTAAALGTGTAAAQGSTASAAGVGSAIAAKVGMTGVAAVWLAVGATVGTGVSLAAVFARTESPPIVTVTPPASHFARASELKPRRFDSTPTVRPAVSGRQLSAPVAKFAAEQPQPSNLKRPPVKVAPNDEPARATRLQDETRGLAAVQQALRDEQPKNALELLAEQESTFPNGALRAERAAARVLALCAAGQGGAARAAAADFLRNHPESPVADRVRRSCTK